MAAATQPATTEPTGTPSPAPTGTTIRVMAVGLWGVVGTLLGYGVLQTVLKAAALFG